MSRPLELGQVEQAVVRRRRQPRAPEGQIKQIELYVMGTQEIIRRTGGEIPHTGDVSESTAIIIERPDLDYRKDVRGGLYDRRMGAFGKTRCATCNNHFENCTGHLGRIVLALPFVGPQWVKFVARLMSLFCFDCPGGHAVLLISDADIRDFDNMGTEDRLKALAKKAESTKECPRSGRTHGACVSYKVGPRSTILRGSDETTIPARDVKTMLARISDEDLHKIGMGNMRPENFVIEVVPVIPNTARPPPVGEERIEHPDLTILYRDLIRANINLASAISGSQTGRGNIQDAETNLITAYSALVGATTAGCPTPRPTARPLLNVKEQTNKKSGWFRKHANGKRGNYIARSVIVPDPRLAMWEIGVPEEMARILTIQEHVYQLNYDPDMPASEYMNRRKDEDGNLINPYYGQARIRWLLVNRLITFIDRGERSYDVSKLPEERLHTFQLRHGDIVHRYIENGDPITINRQPSLHKHSNVAGIVRILPGLAIRFNPVLCAGLGADYDGDEANVTIPQSLETRAEIMMIVDARMNLVSEKNSSMIIGLIQEAVVASTLITADTVVIPRGSWLNYAGTAVSSQIALETIQRAVRLGVNPYSGKVLFSTMLPPTFQFHRKIKETDIQIVNGILVSGVVDGDVLNGQGSIVQSLLTQYGSQITSQFISSLPTMVNRWLQSQGFTFGMRDTSLSAQKRKQVDTILDSVLKTVTEDAATRDTDPVMQLRQEARIMNKLDEARNEAAKIVLSIDTVKTYVIPENTSIIYANYSHGGMMALNTDTASIKFDYSTKPPTATGFLRIPSGSPSGAVAEAYNFPTQGLISVTAHSGNRIQWFGLTQSVAETNKIIYIDEDRYAYAFYTDRAVRIPREVRSIEFDYQHALVTGYIPTGEIGPEGEEIVRTFNLEPAGLVNISIIEESEIGHVAIPYGFERTPFATMVQSRAKGSQVNIAQAIGVVGQQTLQTGRVPLRMTGGTRAIPHFEENDPRPEAQGFCRNSYIQGATPTEFFFHAVTARAAMSDVSVKTEALGYEQRMLVTIMADMYTNEIGAVVSPSGEIFQYQFGGRGLAMESMVKMNNTFTFSDMQARREKVTSVSENAFVFEVNTYNYASTMMMMWSLRRSNPMNNIVCMFRSLTSDPFPTILLNIIRQIADRVIPGDLGDAVQATEYKRLALFPGNTHCIFNIAPDWLFGKDENGKYINARLSFAFVVRHSTGEIEDITDVGSMNAVEIQQLRSAGTVFLSPLYIVKPRLDVRRYVSGDMVGQFNLLSTYPGIWHSIQSGVTFNLRDRIVMMPYDLPEWLNVYDTLAARFPEITSILPEPVIEDLNNQLGVLTLDE